jgi:hypothetical protein
MAHKAVNLSAEMQAALKIPPAEVLHLSPSGNKYVAKDVNTSWKVAGQECLERDQYLNQVNEARFELPGHIRDVCVCASKWLVRNFGLIDWGSANAFKVDAAGNTVDIPTGWFEIPGIPVKAIIMYSGPTAPEIRMQFPNSARPLVDTILEGIKKEQQENSIFRGKAISVDNGLEFFEPNVDAGLVFDERTEEYIEVMILNKLTKRNTLRAKGRRLKMGILLEGPYGCGKTALAQFIAAMAVKHNLTFLYVKNPLAYEGVLNILKDYNDCIVLLEDLDRLSGDTDKIANWLDAVDTKGDDTMSIFTTNHGEVIKERMPKIMRPGRIEQTITIKLPGDRERKMLFNLYCRQSGQAIPVIGDLADAITASEGLNGAAIAHICETAIQFAESYDADVTKGLDSKYLALAASYHAQYIARLGEWDAINAQKKAPTIDDMLRGMLDGENSCGHRTTEDIIEETRNYLAKKETESVDNICAFIETSVEEIKAQLK